MSSSTKPPTTTSSSTSKKEAKKRTPKQMATECKKWVAAELATIAPERRRPPASGSPYDPQDVAAAKRTIDHTFRVGCKASVVVFRDGRCAAIKKIDTGPVVDQAVAAQLREKGIDPDRHRVLQCIVKKYEAPADPIPPEYLPFLRAIAPAVTDGAHMFVLSDMPLLRADGRHPWPMVYRTQAERDAIVTPPPSPAARYIPVYNSFSMDGYLDIAVPTYDDLAVAARTRFRRPVAPASKPWAERKPVALFRGSSTGCGTTARTNPRLALAELSAAGTVAGLDAGITAFGKAPRFDPETGVGWIRSERATQASYVPPGDAQLYKYNVHVEGNVAAFRLANMMRAGCLQLIVDSPYRLWYERLMTVGRLFDHDDPPRRKKAAAVDTTGWHAIAIRRDLSDIGPTLKWCMAHDAECEAIAARGAAFAWSIASLGGFTPHTPDQGAAAPGPRQNASKKSAAVQRVL